jgi:hypothetical protein
MLQQNISMENNLLYNKLLERVLSERPDLAQFAELFQQMNSSNEIEPAKLNAEAELRFKRLAHDARILKADFDDALDELDDLARALGACHICWGDNKRCEKCRGKGKPGHFIPDERLFRALVLPALKRISWLEVKEVNE